jgi:sigma-54 dependent transcriptional regulator, acetoin dehydrogenase operon transcriptional activator AcoR
VSPQPDDPEPEADEDVDAFGMSASGRRDRRTTMSVEGVQLVDGAADPTPGLVLVYSRLYPQLPAALPLTQAVTTLGREADNTLSIPEAPISRYHARFERRADGNVWAVDRQSRNGTFVNGERIGEQPLREHDVLRVGDTLFRFAPSGAHAYTAYRIDGTVAREARPFSHHIAEPLLRGGYQIDALLDRIAKVAHSTISVVITGESGTGKELAAREIHRLSGRAGPFQALNCASLPETLLESELFGYRRGAFTGATSDKIGILRAADGGTLFLDEIGDMPIEAQAKLLRVLQEREVTPVGATVSERVDLRVVCATHRDLTRQVAEGSFRGDLLARLRELSLELPPLRERREDICALVRHFLVKYGQRPDAVTFPFMLALAHYDWPYNVRELESVIRVGTTISAGAPLDVANLPDTVRRALTRQSPPVSGAVSLLPQSLVPPSPSPLPARERGEARASAPTEQQLRELLTRHRGNIAAVGRELGKERMQIHRWLQRYALDPEQFRS